MSITSFPRRLVIFWARFALLAILAVFLTLSGRRPVAAAADTVPPNPWGVQVLSQRA